MNHHNDPNCYVVSDYTATGEGRTVMILITRARPRRDDVHNDYQIEPNFTEQGYNPGVEKNTPQFRALREFAEQFDGFYARGAEVLDRDEFFARYGNQVPEYLYKMTDPDSEDSPPGFHYTSQIYLNFS